MLAGRKSVKSFLSPFRMFYLELSVEILFLCFHVILCIYHQLVLGVDCEINFYVDVGD